MKRSAKCSIILFVIYLFSLSLLYSCGNTNFLNNEPEHLIAVPIPPEPPVEPPTDEPTYHNLFSLEHGEYVRRSSYTGSIDPVGTSITDDLDGDGINDNDETTSNAWVSDYPVIETSITPPITMRIEICDEYNQTVDTVSTDVSASDVENTKDRSTDAVHRNEVNLKTVQYQDTFNKESSSSHHEEESSSSADSKSLMIEASVNIMGSGSTAKGGSSESSSKSDSEMVANSFSEKYGETKTKFKDVPFKNNTRKNGWGVKSNSASKNARNMRNEVKTKTSGTTKVKGNAGYIRAALYINNESVNMPVKLTNIFCSFLLETPEGVLLPVQNFELRNDDYTNFEIDLYGGSTFGPYVIELSNLNTNEIMEAVAKGYNPKIFIINYRMRHVEGSNYREALSGNFDGENLKIIEENAKGRTASIKIVGPNIRDFYRVAAFDTKCNGEDCEETSKGIPDDASITPGVPLEKALSRLSFSGKEIEFAYYALDLSGGKTEVEMDGYINPMILVRTIKSINGIENKIPLTGEEIEGTFESNIDPPLAEPRTVNAYITKPINEWTDEEINDFGLWMVCDDGKFYTHFLDMIEEERDLEGNAIPIFFQYADNPNAEPIPIVKGISSIIWPGDHYDIVYFSFSEYLNSLNSFGSNPIESGSSVTVNTKWKVADLTEDYEFYPTANSIYLGEVGMGERIKLTIKLNDTRFLNPVITDLSYNDVDTAFEINNINYDMNRSVTEDLYTFNEALDFEISFGVNGEIGDWINLKKGERKDYFNSYYDGMLIEESWDFMDQEFYVYITVPSGIDGVDRDGLVKLFLRPAHNNAYRESIWPTSISDMRKFSGEISVIDNNIITVSSPVGIAVDQDLIVIRSTEFIDEIKTETLTTYTIDGVPQYSEINDEYTITLSESIDITKHNIGDSVYIQLTELDTITGCKIVFDDGFETDWNLDLNNLTGVDPLTWHSALATVIGNDLGDATYSLKTAPLLTGNDALELYANFISVRDLGVSISNDIEITNTDELITDGGIYISRWIGDNNYSVPYWNDWSDASYYDEFMDYLTLPVLETTAGTQVRIIKRTTPEYTGTGVEVPYGLNSFFKAPLIERTYDVSVAIDEE